jgi:hypothetical protein
MEFQKLDLASASITEDQKAKLKSLFPEAVTEGGKIDFDRLKATLSIASALCSVCAAALEAPPVLTFQPPLGAGVT